MGVGNCRLEAATEKAASAPQRVQLLAHAIYLVLLSIKLCLGKEESPLVLLQLPLRPLNCLAFRLQLLQTFRHLYGRRSLGQSGQGRGLR